MKKNIHSFVICAYGDSPYLEKCIESLKNQTVSSVIKLTTSTPSDYIRDLCSKYDVGYNIRTGTPSIGNDWNEALRIADTRYATIVHQDDVYEPDYAKKVITAARNTNRITGVEPQIVFTDYSELVNGIKYAKRRNLIIKRILLLSLRLRKLQGFRWAKRNAIRFGNAICCPTVTYNIQYIRKLLAEAGRTELFSNDFRSNLDWEAWEWLSVRKGAFVYLPEILAAHRIHEDSETTRIIQDNDRTREDMVLFSRLWPQGIAALISRLYKKSEDTNNVRK